MKKRQIEYPKAIKVLFMLIMKFFVILLIIATELAFLAQPQIVLAEGKISSTEIFMLINNERSKNNISPLTINNKLIQAANNKAKDLIKNNYFDHNSPTGKTFSSWIKETNYQYSFIGENLAINFQSEKEIVEAWLNSESHKENLLNQNFTETGISIKNENGKIIVVQIFGRPENKPIALEETIRNHLSEIIIYSNKENYINKNLNIA